MVGAQSLVALTGFHPADLACDGCPAGADLSRRGQRRDHQRPRPQQPLYVVGAQQLLAAYPIPPLVKSMAVSIGLTSYNGGVYFGLNADRDAMDDIDVLTARTSPRPSTSCLTRHASHVPEQNAPERTNVPASSVYVVDMRLSTGNGGRQTIMATKSGKRRGLVLGGGGILGAAWMIGALKARGDSRLTPARRTTSWGPRQVRSRRHCSVRESASTNHRPPARPPDHRRSPGRLLVGLREGHRWEPSAHPAPARPGQRQTDPAHACRRCPEDATDRRAQRVPSGRQRFWNGRASGRGFHPFGQWSPHENVWIVAPTTKVAAGSHSATRTPPHGRPSDAVMASCAIPGWFRPMQIDGRTYIDGGAWSATSADLLGGPGPRRGVCAGADAVASRWTSRTRCSAGSSGGGGSR